MTMQSFTTILESSDVHQQVVFASIPDEQATKHKHAELKLELKTNYLKHKRYEDQRYIWNDKCNYP